MKVLILAAGMGTRLKPWTEHHPKALVPVGGIPMLERQIYRLKSSGFDDMYINIHHLGDQIIEFLDINDFGVKVKISDEREKLLDTGGGILHASEEMFSENEEPVLIHNADILSNADLKKLMDYHEQSGNDVTLLTSGRESSRKLIFDRNGYLKGWHDLKSDSYRPCDYMAEEGDREVAFSGIYILGKSAVEALSGYSDISGREIFPIMDFFLAMYPHVRIGEYYDPSLRLLDIGKPDALAKAEKEYGDLL
ncbi:MAG: NTP transferase domain-containing protein [Muribaculaceae bacterium]|nr:NTP transferase domain-containing protein [Muribaculaceae bacterium]